MQNKLEHIFELQDKLNAKFGWSQAELLALPELERLQRVRNFLEVLSIETGEAIKAAKGRWWKQDKDWQGYEHLKEELVDCLHFLFSAYLAAGGNAADIYEKYITKNQFNHERKDWAINEHHDATAHPSQPNPSPTDGGSVPRP